MNPLHHFELHPLIELHLFGIDLSITKGVVMIWIAAILLAFSLIFIARKGSLYPHGLQNFIESIIQFLRDKLILEIIGEEGMPWFPFIATLFLFILTCNLLGLIPGAFTATSNINVTASLAISVFLAVQALGIMKHGLIGYLRGFAPTGIPVWVLPLMVPIEIIGQLAKPFSLAVRLFANMLAGHVVILVFLALILTFKSYIIAPIPLLGVIVMTAFEIFVSVIQAYIFAILTAFYISAAIHVNH